MIIWNEKELKHIKEHLKGVLEVSEDRKSDVEMLLKNFEDINIIEFTNKLLFDVLDDYYSVYWLHGFEPEDLIYLDWLTETDSDIYNKMYKVLW
jgi:hypothetical protein